MAASPVAIRTKPVIWRQSKSSPRIRTPRQTALTGTRKVTSSTLVAPEEARMRK
jgi:hypothetical protein